MPNVKLHFQNFGLNVHVGVSIYDVKAEKKFLVIRSEARNHSMVKEYLQRDGLAETILFALESITKWYLKIR